MSRFGDVRCQQYGKPLSSKMPFWRCSGPLKVVIQVRTWAIRWRKHLYIPQIRFPSHWFTLAISLHLFIHNYQTHALFGDFFIGAKCWNFGFSWAVPVMLETPLGMFWHSKRLNVLGKVFLRNFKKIRIFRQKFWRPSNLDAWRNTPDYRKNSCFGGLWKVWQINRRYVKQVSNWSPLNIWRVRAIKHDQIVFCRHPKVSRTPHLRAKCPFSRCWKSWF